MQETEITVQVFEEAETVCEKLLALGFMPVREYVLIDYYFTGLSPEEAKKASYIELLNRSLLVRHVVEDGSARTQLCYKKKQLDDCGNVIGEEKFKTNVESLQGALNVLRMSGLYMWCELRNDSVVYGKDGNELALQAMEGLGLFIECEESAQHAGMTPGEKFGALKSFIDGLGLWLGDDYSCKKVFMKYRASLV